MQGLWCLLSYCAGCFSMALLIRYKMKNSVKVKMAQKSNKGPVEVDFSEVDSDV